MAKKRSVAVLMLVGILCCLFPCAALADGVVQLHVATVDGAVGDTVSLPVTIDNCDNVDSLYFDLNYDAANLEVLTVRQGTAFPAEYCVSNFDAAGRIRTACCVALGLEAGGEVIVVDFKILKSGGSSVTLSNVEVTTLNAAAKANGIYVQEKAYVQVAAGGVTVAGAALPNAVVTPWIAETPTPSPTPEPTPTPTPAPAATEAAPAPTAPAADDGAADAPKQPGGNLTVILLIAAGVLLAAGVCAVVIVRGKRKKSRRRR